MNPKATNLINELQAVYERLDRPLVIVETGTIRRTEPEYEAGDGHSTRYIAEWVKKTGSIFTGSAFHSIDNDISIANKYLLDLMGLRIYVFLKEGNSLDWLPKFKHIDFCYIDSANDAENTLQEFLIAWPKITPGGCLMVDDCNEASEELFKGDKLIPHLREKNINFEQLETNQIIIRK